MSVSRSPIRNELRRREDEADARRTATIIGGFLFVAACAFVMWLTWMAGR